MKGFIVNILKFAVIPFIAFILMAVPYVISDPYMDYGHYKNYSWKYHFQQIGDLSTKKLLQSNTPYNSFIFGSSRTISLYACYLNKKFPNSSFFHYANWNESIGGIYHKLILLDSLGYNIDRVFIYLDTDYTFREHGAVRDFDHYLISNEAKGHYYIQHMNSYYEHLNKDKIRILLGMQVHGEVFPNWHSDIITNDANHNCNNESILLNYSNIDTSESYLHSIDSMRNSGFLYNRPTIQQYLEPQISDAELNILDGIKALFGKHHTDYYVVIPPLYDQNKFAIEDQVLLKKLFQDKLFDYSGINTITENVYNFPDRHHFQPYISKMIVDSIIKSKEPLLP